MNGSPNPRSAPIRVAIVDDSALMRRMLSAALTEAPDIDVVGTARDAFEGRELIRASDPDVITLDVAMPGMSGLEFLQKIMELRPTPVIMVSNLTAEGAETTLGALQLGAIDVVQKPQGPEAMRTFGSTLQAKVRLAAASRPSMAHGRSEAAVRPGLGASFSRSLIAIGASTGGVSALTTLLGALPDALPPIVIVQHMPKGYPERFASRLAAELRRDVAEARTGELLGTGMIRIAPGDMHLRVQSRASGIVTELAEGEPVSGHRPSVDVLFESVARAVGRRALGLILTGMGRDGAVGLAAMRRAGAICLAQGPESSVVWGMPKAACAMGAVDETAELPALPARVCHFLTTAARNGGATTR